MSKTEIFNVDGWFLALNAKDFRNALKAGYTVFANLKNKHTGARGVLMKAPESDRPT